MSCIICQHPKRSAIETDLFNKISKSQIARKYNLKSRDPLYRHIEHMHTAFPDVEYGNFDALNERAKEHIQHASNEQARLHREITRLKASQTIVSDEIPKALGLLHLSDIPDLASLKQRYRTLSILLHPDKQGTDEFQQSLNWAYQVILKRIS